MINSRVMPLWILRILIAGLAAMYITQASAVWYDPPLGMDAGYYMVDSLGNVDRTTLHVRLAADSHDCTKWGIIWNYTDEANFTRATLSLPSDRKHSELYGTEALMEVVRYTDGSVEEVCSRKLADVVEDCRDMNSLKLVYDGGRATLYAGTTYQKEVCSVPFGSRGGIAAFFCDGPVKVQRVDITSHVTSDTHSCEYASLEQLAEHIRASADPMEGFWEYLDRSTDPAKSVMGGHYTLATVRRNDVYDIVYIKGAEVAADSWQPLQVKGVLTPTIFRGNYDMEWISADMQKISDDTDAQLSDDSAILTLRFPVLGAQVRMRRLSL